MNTIPVNIQFGNDFFGCLIPVYLGEISQLLIVRICEKMTIHVDSPNMIIVSLHVSCVTRYTHVVTLKACQRNTGQE